MSVDLRWVWLVGALWTMFVLTRLSWRTARWRLERAAFIEALFIALGGILWPITWVVLGFLPRSR